MDQTQTPSEHPKLDALIAGYLEAVERGEAPDRSQIIAANPDLATELRAFFDDLDHVQRAAASPNDGPVPPKPDAAHASTVIRPNHEPTPGVIIAGRYKLLENIGEGGMGSVWVAEQLKPVKRKVAIKLIKPGMDSKQVLARFEAERQALAVMDHPNIAKVFDGGLTEQGRPYFVMEYVKGVPFTDYCDRARLPLKDRLTLFIAVCSAVQHAHQKGIVHRDLKPSNILICLYDGHPVPKVIDFGLAKAMHQPLTEQSIFTGHGVMVGTPLYMSPEQAESNNLDIDTRTDIYSLGVVLYELLTGSTPLERQQLQKAAFDEVLRLIKEVEPPRPSLRLSGSESLASIAAQRSIDPKQLSRSLAGDLDWIVMKTLDKERSRRYETANGLARDIERFLNEEPVEACPPSTAYRVRKFIKRYKPQVTAATIVLLALIAGIVGTSWGLRKAKIAEEKAVASEGKTIQALADVTKERDAKVAALSSEANQRAMAEKQRQAAEDNARLLEDQKYSLGLQSAYLSLEKGDLGIARRMLTDLPERLRQWEWKWLMAETDCSLGVYTLPSSKRFHATTRDGAHSIVADVDSVSGPFQVIASADGSVLATFSIPKVEELIAVAISDNAKRCAFLAINESDGAVGLKSSVYVWDLERNAMIWTKTTTPSTGVLFTQEDGFGLSDDGDKLLVKGLKYGSDTALSEYEFSSWNTTWIFSLSDDSKSVTVGSPFGHLSSNGRFLMNLTHLEYKDLVSPQQNEHVTVDKYKADKDNIHYINGNTACLYSDKFGWQAYSLSENRILRQLGHHGQERNIRWYDNGNCCVRIRNNSLEYSLHGDRNGVFTLGFVDMGINEITCDEEDRYLYGHRGRTTYRFPLPDADELGVLCSLNGSLSAEGRSIQCYCESLPDMLVVRSADTLSLVYAGKFGEFLFARDDSLLFVKDNESCSLNQVSLQTDQKFMKWDIPSLSKSSNHDCAISQDARYFAHVFEKQAVNSNLVGDADSGAILVVNRLSDREVLLTTELAWPFPSILFIDQSRVIVQSGSEIISFDFNGESLSSLSRTIEMEAAAVSDSCSTLATVFNDRVKLWDVKTLTPQKEWTIPQSESFSVSWCQDDTRLIVRSSAAITICDPSLGTGVLTIPTTLLLSGRLCSPIPFKQRWEKWSASLKDENSVGGRDLAIDYLTKRLNAYRGTRGGLDACRDRITSELLADASIKPVVKAKAFQLLRAAHDALDQEKVETLANALRVNRVDFLSILIEEGVQPSVPLFLKCIGKDVWQRLDYPSNLNDAAWDLIVRIDATQKEYSRALHLSNVACEFENDNPNYLNTLGVAQYRSRLYRDAISTLQKSESCLSGRRSFPSNWIFIAMAKFQLGEVDEARSLLEKVRQEQQKSGEPLDGEDAAFLKEAEELIKQLQTP